MKPAFITLLTFALAVPAFASNDKDAAKQAEMMAKWQKYSTPVEAHKKLAELAGKWTYVSKMYESEDKVMEETKGSSTMKMVMGGRYLQQEVSGKSMGMDFKGLSFVGYNNLKQKYETIWLDNMSTGIMHGEGSYDESSKTYTDKGEFSCPMSKDNRADYKSEWKIIDKNNMTYTMWGPGMDGKTIKMMEMTYKRK